jgi:methyltransferase (TIGR00027 family)
MANKPSWNLAGPGPFPARAGWQRLQPVWPLPGQSAGSTPFPQAPPSVLDPVGQTARWVAAARAVETARADRLFDDPYAALLAGQDGETCLKVLGVRGVPVVGYLAMRTRFLDDLIAQGVHDGIRQCVILAAGMDTRAFRLPWAEGMRVFELDRPAVLAIKDALLTKAGAKPQCERHVIGVDLTGPWVSSLRLAGFDDSQPAIWLVEGLLMYLEAPDVQRLLATIADLAAPGSRIGGDIPNPPARPGQFRLMMNERDRDLSQKFGTNDPAGLFAAHGWQVTVASPDQVAESVKRPPSPPMRLPDGHVIRNWLVAGRR